MPHLEDLGRRLYESGKTKFTDWYKGMEKAIGSTWRTFTRQAKDIFARVAKPLMNERGSIGNPFAKPRIGTLEDLRKSWDERGIDNYAYEKNGAIFLSEIRIPKNNRGKGLGTKAMQELIDYADRTGQKILLTPSIDFGATSVSRLEKFYKQFGFTSNKGSKKDYRYRETMIRRPEVGTKAVSGLLRHKNLRTTEIYLHSIDESQRSAMDGLEGKFAPKKTNPLPAAATKNEKEVTDIP